MHKLRAFYQANNFPITTFKKYFKYSTVSELIMDVVLPTILSSLLIFYASYSIDSLSDLISKFQQVSGQVISAISILAGFNIASITVLSTINGGPTGILKRKKSTDGSSNLYDMLICFFSWAVIIQLIVVLFSILLYYIGSFIPEGFKDLYVPRWTWLIAIAWMSITIHSVFLSIRNMKTLYLYVTYDPKKENEANKENQSE
ncbi:hypothetical protein [Paenibacillus sp. MDMC362]|uniref:hypothetical protein n=1 Tax=Paenibacillus sp. MDMC362 TaxID=2977365 RepID=UPI000DC56759|nr:hypothetical protein [Paenibacillus sp. MDMC362]RAR39653.1 hypothetical protein DP091_29650 [Paenibacillus sp. MDMC362]